MQRPKKAAEYYNEDIFVIKSSLAKYKCIHCEKLPKSFFRCKCGRKNEKQEVGKGRARFEDSTGLSCSDCTHQACIDCERSDQYEPDTITNGNIRMLTVFCENKCGKNIILTNRENRSHIKNECKFRKKLCKYAWAGCKIEGAGDEHEREVGVHVLAAIDKLHKRIKKIEAKLNPGPQTTREL